MRVLARGPARPRGDFMIHTRHLLYVTLPGSLERPIYPNGDGIVVLDADRNYQFVKRISYGLPAARMPGPEITGVTASVPENKL